MVKFRYINNNSVNTIINPRNQIINNSLNTNRNGDCGQCPTPFRMPYLGSRKSIKCISTNNCSNNIVSIIKENEVCYNNKITRKLINSKDSNQYKQSMSNYLYNNHRTYGQHDEIVYFEHAKKKDGMITNEYFISDKFENGIEYCNDMNVNNIKKRYTTVKKYTNKRYRQNGAVSTSNYLNNIKHDSIYKNSYNNYCINGSRCSLYKNSIPNYKPYRTDIIYTDKGCPMYKEPYNDILNPTFYILKNYNVSLNNISDTLELNKTINGIPIINVSNVLTFKYNFIISNIWIDSIPGCINNDDIYSLNLYFDIDDKKILLDNKNMTWPTTNQLHNNNLIIDSAFNVSIGTFINIVPYFSKIHNYYFDFGIDGTYGKTNQKFRFKDNNFFKFNFLDNESIWWDLTTYDSNDNDILMITDEHVNSIIYTNKYFKPPPIDNSLFNDITHMYNYTDSSAYSQSIKSTNEWYITNDFIIIGIQYLGYPLTIKIKPTILNSWAQHPPTILPTFKWYRVDIDNNEYIINDAIESTYITTPDDYSHKIKCEMTYQMYENGSFELKTSSVYTQDFNIYYKIQNEIDELKNDGNININKGFIGIKDIVNSNIHIIGNNINGETLYAIDINLGSDLKYYWQISYDNVNFYDMYAVQLIVNSDLIITKDNNILHYSIDDVIQEDIIINEGKYDSNRLYEFLNSKLKDFEIIEDGNNIHVSYHKNFKFLMNGSTLFEHFGWTEDKIFINTNSNELLIDMENALIYSITDNNYIRVKIKYNNYIYNVNKRLINKKFDNYTYKDKNPIVNYPLNNSYITPNQLIWANNGFKASTFNFDNPYRDYSIYFNSKDKQISYNMNYNIYMNTGLDVNIDIKHNNDNNYVNKINKDINITGIYKWIYIKSNKKYKYQSGVINLYNESNELLTYGEDVLVLYQEFDEDYFNNGDKLINNVSYIDKNTLVKPNSNDAPTRKNNIYESSISPYNIKSGWKPLYKKLNIIDTIINKNKDDSGGYIKYNLFGDNYNQTSKYPIKYMSNNDDLTIFYKIGLKNYDNINISKIQIKYGVDDNPFKNKYAYTYISNYDIQIDDNVIVNKYRNVVIHYKELTQLINTTSGYVVPEYIKNNFKLLQYNKTGIVDSVFDIIEIEDIYIKDNKLIFILSEIPISSFYYSINYGLNEYLYKDLSYNNHDYTSGGLKDIYQNFKSYTIKSENNDYLMPFSGLYVINNIPLMFDTIHFGNDDNFNTLYIKYSGVIKIEDTDPPEHFMNVINVYKIYYNNDKIYNINFNDSEKIINENDISANNFYTTNSYVNKKNNNDVWGILNNNIDFPNTSEIEFYANWNASVLTTELLLTTTTNSILISDNTITGSITINGTNDTLKYQIGTDAIQTITIGNNIDTYPLLLEELNTEMTGFNISYNNDAFIFEHPNMFKFINDDSTCFTILGFNIGVDKSSYIKEFFIEKNDGAYYYLEYITSEGTVNKLVTSSGSDVMNITKYAYIPNINGQPRILHAYVTNHLIPLTKNINGIEGTYNTIGEEITILFNQNLFVDFDTDPYLSNIGIITTNWGNVGDGEKNVRDLGIDTFFSNTTVNSNTYTYDVNNTNINSNTDDKIDKIKDGVWIDDKSIRVWASENNDTLSDWDGGWNLTYDGVDPTKTYIYYCYGKMTRKGTDVNGCYWYFGTSSNSSFAIKPIDSSTRYSNPYFNVPTLSVMPLDIWCMSIGVVFPHNHTNVNYPSISGVYRLDTLEKIYTPPNTSSVRGSWRFLDANVSKIMMRNYLYYDGHAGTATSSCNIEWYRPTIFCVEDIGTTNVYDIDINYFRFELFKLVNITYDLKDKTDIKFKNCIIDGQYLKLYIRDDVSTFNKGNNITDNKIYYNNNNWLYGVSNGENNYISEFKIDNKPIHIINETTNPYIFDCYFNITNGYQIIIQLNEDVLENNSDKDDYIIDVNHDIIVNEIVDNPGYTFPNTDNIVTINERPCILLDLKHPPIENMTYTLTYNTHNVYNYDKRITTEILSEDLAYKKTLFRHVLDINIKENTFPQPQFNEFKIYDPIAYTASTDTIVYNKPTIDLVDNTLLDKTLIFQFDEKMRNVKSPIDINKFTIESKTINVLTTGLFNNAFDNNWDQFKVIDNPINSVNIQNNDKEQIEIVMSNKINCDEIYLIKYEGVNISNATHYGFIFDKYKYFNNLISPKILFICVNIKQSDQLIINFDAPVEYINPKLSDFVLNTIGNTDNQLSLLEETVDGIVLLKNDINFNEMVLYLNRNITEGDEFTLKYIGYENDGDTYKKIKSKSRNIILPTDIEYTVPGADDGGININTTSNPVIKQDVAMNVEIGLKSTTFVMNNFDFDNDANTITNGDDVINVDTFKTNLETDLSNLLNINPSRVNINRIEATNSIKVHMTILDLPTNHPSLIDNEKNSATDIITDFSTIINDEWRQLDLSTIQGGNPSNYNYNEADRTIMCTGYSSVIYPSEYFPIIDGNVEHNISITIKNIETNDTSGNATGFYCGVASYDSNFNHISVDQWKSYNYGVASAYYVRPTNIPIGTNKTFTSTFKGFNEVGNAPGNTPNRFDPLSDGSGTSYFRIIILVNYYETNTNKVQIMNIKYSNNANYNAVFDNAYYLTPDNWLPKQTVEPVDAYAKLVEGYPKVYTFNYDYDGNIITIDDGCLKDATHIHTNDLMNNYYKVITLKYNEKLFNTDGNIAAANDFLITANQTNNIIPADIIFLNESNIIVLAFPYTDDYVLNDTYNLTYNGYKLFNFNKLCIKHTDVSCTVPNYDININEYGNIFDDFMGNFNWIKVGKYKPDKYDNGIIIPPNQVYGLLEVNDINDNILELGTDYLLFIKEYSDFFNDVDYTIFNGYKIGQSGWKDVNKLFNPGHNIAMQNINMAGAKRTHILDINDDNFSKQAKHYIKYSSNKQNTFSEYIIRTNNGIEVKSIKFMWGTNEII